MQEIESASVDLILCDLPYGTTACAWDSVIPFAPLWAEYKRIAKKDVAIVLTATQPFTTALIWSNIDAFSYEWIYEKTNPKGFLNAKRRPLTAHESILVFSYGKPPYYPQKWTIPDHLRTKRKHATSKTAGEVYGARDLVRWDDDGSRFPTSVIGFSNRVGRGENFHPTQKPVEMMEYLIKTYTEPGQIVMDNCMGSGTTGVAAKRCGRKFVGFEQKKSYFEIACARIEQGASHGQLFVSAPMGQEQACMFTEAA
ncbi:cytosine methyltransferase [Massilia violaceinigra]|uniref:Methyltransferase n=2 Tax=Massilia violaceinigra TaxID=2045208 RepID=A0A2D2DVZ9_9BURK|nr:cytosine methyltransferase [Massilia violaceinigra]